MNEVRRHGRELLDEARRERTPDKAARERVFAALMASAALAAASSAAAAPAVEAKLLTGVSKWLVLAGLAGSVTGALYIAGHVGAKAPGAPSVAQVALATPSAAAPTPERDAPTAPTPATLPAVPNAAEAPSPHEAPTAPRSATTRRDAEPPSLEAELAGLQAAHAAYRGGNAARSLALIAEHKSSFPKSQLSTERATLEVLSLCRVGRVKDARSLAERLRKNAGNTAALSGLDGSCAAK